MCLRKYMSTSIFCIPFNLHINDPHCFVQKVFDPVCAALIPECSRFNVVNGHYRERRFPRIIYGETCDTDGY